MLATILILAFGVLRQDWYTIAPEGKNFRVALPSKPDSVSTRTLNNPSGRSELTAVQLKVPDATYSVHVTENRGRVDPSTLDAGIRKFASNRKATVGAISKISVDGNPGREFEMSERSAGGLKRSKMRWVTSGNSLFMLRVAGVPGGEIPADSGRFLGSLQIGAANKSNAGTRENPIVAGKDDATARDAEADEETSEPKSKVATSDAKPESDADAEAPETKATGKSTSRKAPSKVTLLRIPRNLKSYPPEDLVDVSRSFLGSERDGFRDIGPAGSVLVGVRASYIERFGGPKVRSAQPIYRVGTKHYAGRIYGEVVPPVTTVVAKSGYAVGGLVTHTGLTVDGFRMVFMKVDGDRLDPNDQYNSVWIGDEQGGGPGEVMSNGGLVVGLQGRSGAEVFALGITTLK